MGHDASRPTLVLSGFFGRGNCGDEALLQTQYERFSHDYEIVISVDERGAYDGFWNWYPYDRCRIVHQANLAVVTEEQVVGLHVGGGGLPYGFNAAQVVRARSYDKSVFLTGVDAASPISQTSAAAIAHYHELFDFISLRSTRSWRTFSGILDRCHHGADWALALETDGPLPVSPSGVALLTLREFPPELISADYVQSLKHLVSVLRDRFGEVTLLPFCPEDERFLDHLPCTDSLHREIHWWNPRRVQREIAAASAVISVGRLHPLIFAANVGVPTVFAEPLPGESRWPTSLKASQFCQDHGWPYHGSIDEAAHALSQRMPLEPAHFSNDYRDRWNTMQAELSTRLAARARQVRGGTKTG